MAKFCTHCGKALIEGKNCDCIVENAPTSFDFDWNQMMSTYVNMGRGMFTKPVDTLLKFTKKETFHASVFAIVVHCLLNGIFLYVFYGEMMGSISMFSGYRRAYTLGLSNNVPFIKVFLYGVILLLVGILVLGFMLYSISHFIFKDTVSLKAIYTQLGICSTFAAPLTVFLILTTYLSLPIMILLWGITSIFYFTYLYQGVSELLKIDKNKFAYVWVSSICVTLFGVLYILPSIFV